MLRGSSILGGILAVGLGCTGAGSTASDRGTVIGAWRGPHASLLLTDSAGSIEYDCGHGALHSPLQPDAEGRFTVAGAHVREHGGPVRDGEVPDSIPAQYVGQVRGDLITLRVLVASDTLGPFALRRDGAPQVIKCL